MYMTGLYINKNKLATPSSTLDRGKGAQYHNAYEKDPIYFSISICSPKTQQYAQVGTAKDQNGHQDY